MKELAFPFLGTLFVFFVLVPAATLVARGLLVLRRRSLSALSTYGTAEVWALLVAPVVLPVGWCLSAGVHQFERGSRFEVCLYDPAAAPACHDALLFAAALAAVFAVGAGVRYRRHLGDTRHRGRRIPATDPRTLRLFRLCAGHPALVGHRATVVDGGRVPVCTRGLFRPHTEVSAACMDAFDDGQLLAALLHERAHARGFDPLRFFILSVCLTVNPLARVLRGDAARWRLAREAACDETAVRSGCAPLSLASAILAAARGGAPLGPAATALCGAAARGIGLRVAFLLQYAEAGCAARCGRARASVIAAGLAAAVVLPHVVGTGPLDAVHRGVEEVLGSLSPG